MTYTYKYPRPMVTVDILLLKPAPQGPEILLIQRKNAPFAEKWALPGGYVDADEALEAAASRELAEETGMHQLPLKQLGAFGDPGRDPRGHTVTIVYGAALPEYADDTPNAADDARAARWFPLSKLPPLAFDHAEIIAACTPLLTKND